MRPLAIGLLLLLFSGLLATQNPKAPPPSSAEFLYTVAKRYEPLAWMDGGERFSSGAAVYLRDAHGSHRLAPSLAASADPTVSFDGKRVLLAGKKTSRDAWQIWEVALAGGDPQRITSCAEDCIRPFYLPENRIVYAEKVGGRFQIQNGPATGGKPLPLTYGPENALPADVLRDGRVLFESAFAGGNQRAPEIYAVYSDGSGVESYRCDHGHARYSARQVASGDIVFVLSRGLARLTSARANEIPISAPDGEYAGDLAENAAGEWLLPWRANATNQFQLMWWTPGQQNLRPALKESGSNLVEPTLIRERPIPKRHPSALHDWATGNLLCLNAYTSKHKFAAASIQSVRVYTRQTTGEVQLLGTAPVEADGSFFVQVQGDKPLQLELIDASGKTLKREEGWFWLRRGEQRVCVGCHAGPETAPENAVPMVLMKSTTPADMTHLAGQASDGGH